ncbi:hypothetical protein L873DRAFT_632020 [Choiromyces venosus 120613-1]|uniref:Uncharacterized protein n=1 Tax=Choiromyces venosus 120613-1 TaxID=1336337 RepID=A0A3N4JT88_9PEZI|nr:hypothetical protein L873DRAFT_632020 [Choiromyces venosus 120613-1]
MEFYESRELPNMRSKKGVLKSPPYNPEGEPKKLKAPETANIIPLEYVPFSCRQEEQGNCTRSDRNLEKMIVNQLRLPPRLADKVNHAKEMGEEVFRYSFGSAGNMIEVFLKVDRDDPRPHLSLPNATLEETNKLGDRFEKINIGENGFYVALDKKLRKIFVLFGSGLKIVYGDKIGQYITDSICWNIEEYSQIVPPRIPKDSRHKEYEKWLLMNPHLCWPPWA